MVKVKKKPMLSHRLSKKNNKDYFFINLPVTTSSPAFTE
jgi:hypothetical protein